MNEYPLSQGWLPTALHRGDPQQLDSGRVVLNGGTQPQTLLVTTGTMRKLHSVPPCDCMS